MANSYNVALKLFSKSAISCQSSSVHQANWTPKMVARMDLNYCQKSITTFCRAIRARRMFKRMLIVLARSFLWFHSGVNCSCTSFIAKHESVSLICLHTPNTTKSLYSWLRARTTHPPPLTKVSSRQPAGVRRRSKYQNLNLFEHISDLCSAKNAVGVIIDYYFLYNGKMTTLVHSVTWCAHALKKGSLSQ